MTFRPRGFLECTGAPRDARIVLLGLPFDGTCTFRPGARFGPGAVREASWVLETYSPRLDAELPGERIADLGDLDLPVSDAGAAWARVKTAAAHFLEQGVRVLGLGGEHSLTAPLVHAYVERYPDLTVLQFDAHADLRDRYEGESRSHACTIRRCLDVLPAERLFQFGIRSGTREEFAWMRAHGTLRPADPASVAEALAQGNGPLYLTLDVDVFDPALVPGTGTPEPGGIGFGEFEDCLGEIARCGRPLVGADVMELCPPHDPGGTSAVMAAKAVRELLILMAASV